MCLRLPVCIFLASPAYFAISLQKDSYLNRDFKLHGELTSHTLARRFSDYNSDGIARTAFREVYLKRVTPQFKICAMLISGCDQIPGRATAAPNESLHFALRNC